MSRNWDGRIKPLKAKRTNKSTSPYVPSKRRWSIPEKEIDLSLEYGKIGRIFSPDQVERYKSNWTRYQRALSLRDPEVRFDQFTREEYWYESPNAPTGYWVVSYVDAIINVLKSRFILPGNERKLTEDDLKINGINLDWNIISSPYDLSLSSESVKYPTVSVQNTQDKDYIDGEIIARLQLNLTGVDEGTKDETSLSKILDIYTAPTRIINVPLTITDVTQVSQPASSLVYCTTETPIPYKYIVLPEFQKAFETFQVWRTSQNGDDLLILEASLDNPYPIREVALSNDTKSFSSLYQIIFDDIFVVSDKIQYAFIVRGSSNAKAWVQNKLDDDISYTTVKARHDDYLDNFVEVSESNKVTDGNVYTYKMNTFELLELDNSIVGKQHIEVESTQG